MCGFVGIVGELATLTDNCVIKRMSSFLKLRGPDSESILQSKDLLLVFRRLAINDIQHGNQPFVLDNGRYSAVINGEIYNYKELIKTLLYDVEFHSYSDCEIILHLYKLLGRSFVKELNGMFSIAIWDKEKKELFLARDRFGIKPLYYNIIGNSVIFASELKAILTHPMIARDLDWKAFDEVPSSTYPYQRPVDTNIPTGVTGSLFIAPGEHLNWSRYTTPIIEKYWQCKEVSNIKKITHSRLNFIERYSELIEDSVKSCLMSDVPICIFLSGGLDSSLIAAIATHYKKGLRAVTCVDKAIEETGDPLAAVDLANHLGLELHLVKVDDDSLSATIPMDLETLEYFVWIMDFPFFDLEFIYKHELHRYIKSIDPTVKVALSGQGADEFAGGYSMLTARKWESTVLIEDSAYCLSVFRDLGISRPLRSLISSNLINGLNQNFKPDNQSWQTNRLGDLAAYNLWHEDRTSAANGMETRLPYLDHRLVEFLFSIPQKYHRDLFYNKEIIRKSALNFMPERFTKRDKVPLFATSKYNQGRSTVFNRKFVIDIFDQFKTKYLESETSILSKDKIMYLYSQVVNADNNDYVVDLLLRCITLSIFHRMCKDIAHDMFIEPHLRPINNPVGTKI